MSFSRQYANSGKNRKLHGSMVVEKSFKMEQVNIEVVKLTPEERTGA